MKPGGSSRIYHMTLIINLKRQKLSKRDTNTLQFIITVRKFISSCLNFILLQVGIGGDEIF